MTLLRCTASAATTILEWIHMSVSMLTSNGVELPNDERYIGALIPSTIFDLQQGYAKRRYEEDGYLLIRGALPAKEILDLRENYLSLFPPDFVTGGDYRQGVFSGHFPEDLPPHGTRGHPAHDFVRSEPFRRFTDRATLSWIAQVLLGGPVERVRRTPLRHYIKGRVAASRAHMDSTYIPGRPEETVTLWIPLGDCPVEAGGLVYLEGSHRHVSIEAIRPQNPPTDRPHDNRPITHDLKWLSDLTGRRWLTADYRAGDVIAHLPTLIHASLDPSTDKMRISIDVRFRRTHAPCDPRWLCDWSADDGY